MPVLPTENLQTRLPKKSVGITFGEEGLRNSRCPSSLAWPPFLHSIPGDWDGWAWAWVVAGGNGRWAEGLRGVAGGDGVPLRSIEPSVGSPVELGTWAQIQLRSLTCKLDPPLGSGA